MNIIVINVIKDINEKRKRGYQHQKKLQTHADLHYAIVRNLKMEEGYILKPYKIKTTVFFVNIAVFNAESRTALLFVKNSL